MWTKRRSNFVYKHNSIHKHQCLHKPHTWLERQQCILNFPASRRNKTSWLSLTAAKSNWQHLTVQHNRNKWTINKRAFRPIWETQKIRKWKNSKPKRSSRCFKLFTLYFRVIKWLTRTWPSSRRPFELANIHFTTKWMFSLPISTHKP